MHNTTSRRVPLFDDLRISSTTTRRERIVATAPLLVFSAAYLVPIFTGGWTIPGLDAQALGRAMQIEFLVLVAGVFLIAPALAPIRPDNPGRRGLRIFFWCIFLLLFGNFTNIAWQGFGTSGALTFVMLTAMTFGGELVSNKNPNEAPARCLGACARGLVSLVVFLVLLEAFDLPVSATNWTSDARVFPAGSLYFGMLGMAYLSGFFSWAHKQLVELGFRHR